MGLSVNGGMGNFPFLPMLVMPDASAGLQHGTLKSHGSPAGGPGVDQIDQMPRHPADLRR